MGHTSEQRDGLATPLCGARKKDKTTCRAFAGQGTDHLGVGNCKYHGGALPSHKKHAVAVEAQRRMVAFGTPDETVTAPQALMRLLRASAGHVGWLAGEVAGLDSLASQEAEVLVKLYASERDRLVRVGEACVRAGVAEHLVRIDSLQAASVVQAVRDASRDIGLGSDELTALGIALRKRLGEAAGDDSYTAIADERLAKLREKILSTTEQRVATLADRRARELSA